MKKPIFVLVVLVLIVAAAEVCYMRKLSEKERTLRRWHRQLELRMDQGWETSPRPAIIVVEV